MLDEKAIAEQRDKIREVYEDKVATINGNDYHFLSMTHKKRLKVFSYMTSVQNELSSGNFGFMGALEWEGIENIICSHIQFNGMILAKIPNHWEEHAKDYILLMSMALGVISYPFLPEDNIG